MIHVIQVSTSGIANIANVFTLQQDNKSENFIQFEQSSQIDQSFEPLNEWIQELEQPYNVTYHFTGYHWYDKGGLDLEIDLRSDLHDKILFNKEICECNEFDYVGGGCGLNCSPYVYRPSQIRYSIPTVMSLEPKVATGWPYLISFQIVEGPHKPNCYRHFCGGSLITPNLVLTAAHCFKKQKYLEFNQYEGAPLINLYAAQFPSCRHAGSGPRYPAGKRAKVTYMYIHPDWDPFTGNADIAIIVLDTFFQGPYVTINANDTFSEDVPLYIAGYGAVNQQEVLQPFIYNMRKPLEEEVDYISPEECRSLLLEFNSTTDLREDTMMCAYNIWGDTCQGDSGGPLSIHKDYRQWVDEDVLVGVISWGPSGQCQSRFADQAPVVATKVSAFVDWIEDTLSSYRASINSLCQVELIQKMHNPQAGLLEYLSSYSRQLSNQRVRQSKVEFSGEQINLMDQSPRQEQIDNNGD